MPNLEIIQGLESERIPVKDLTPQARTGFYTLHDLAERRRHMFDLKSPNAVLEHIITGGSLPEAKTYINIYETPTSDGWTLTQWDVYEGDDETPSHIAKLALKFLNHTDTTEPSVVSVTRTQYPPQEGPQPEPLKDTVRAIESLSSALAVQYDRQFKVHDGPADVRDAITDAGIPEDVVEALLNIPTEPSDVDLAA